jgi:flagellar hook-basal body complex protein FliE
MAIDNVSGVRADISEMLSKIREMSNKTNVFSNQPVINPGQNAQSSFTDMMSAAKNAFGTVSDLQNENDRVRSAYIAGDSHVSMSQVIVAAQKSKMAFEGLVTVRNKILDAYKEIMSMSV